MVEEGGVYKYLVASRENNQSMGIGSGDFEHILNHI
jgi:hypothetical protein